MFWDLSKLDSNEGIQFRNKDLYNVISDLKSPTGGVLPEHVLWLLLTGHLPNADQRKEIIKDLVGRMQLDKDTVNLVKQFPKELHPMAKLSAGMLLLQKNSKFSKAYSSGVNKKDLWE